MSVLTAGCWLSSCTPSCHTTSELQLQVPKNFPVAKVLGQPRARRQSSNHKVTTADSPLSLPMAFNSHKPAARLASQALRSCRSSQTSVNSATFRPLISATIATPTTTSASFSTSHPRLQEGEAHAEDPPRWARTPERMKSTFSPHVPQTPKQTWTVNEDPAKLDDALNNLLGNGGERLLPDELKWLAVTHKSFDQGRRGFNDRLAFLGKQIAVVEAIQGILVETPVPGEQGIPEDAFAGRRTPFEHKALEAADRLSIVQPDSIFELKKLQKLAADTGIGAVVRWLPRRVSLNEGRCAIE